MTRSKLQSANFYKQKYVRMSQFKSEQAFFDYIYPITKYLQKNKVINGYKKIPLMHKVINVASIANGVISWRKQQITKESCSPKTFQRLVREVLEPLGFVHVKENYYIDSENKKRQWMNTYIFRNHEDWYMRCTRAIIAKHGRVLVPFNECFEEEKQQQQEPHNGRLSADKVNRVIKLRKDNQRKIKANRRLKMAGYALPYMEKLKEKKRAGKKEQEKKQRGKSAQKAKRILKYVHLKDSVFSSFLFKKRIKNILNTLNREESKQRESYKASFAPKEFVQTMQQERLDKRILGAQNENRFYDDMMRTALSASKESGVFVGNTRRLVKVAQNAYRKAKRHYKLDMNVAFVGYFKAIITKDLYSHVQVQDVPKRFIKAVYPICGKNAFQVKKLWHLVHAAYESFIDKLSWHEFDDYLTGINITLIKLQASLEVLKNASVISNQIHFSCLVEDEINNLLSSRRIQLGACLYG